MMDFIADLERKVDRMKADSETAAEELIQLRGHHQSMKKTHQLLSQQVAYYVQMARNQEQVLTGIQQEVVELKQKRSKVEGGSANGHVTNGERGQNTCANGSDVPPKRPAGRSTQLETLVNFPTHEMPMRSSALVDASYSTAPSLSATLMPQSKAVVNGVSTQHMAMTSTTTTCVVPVMTGSSIGASSEGHDGWIDGSSLRGLLSDVFEENTQEMLSLTDLFGDDADQSPGHKSKRSRT